MGRERASVRALCAGLVGCGEGKALLCLARSGEGVPRARRVRMRTEMMVRAEYLVMVAARPAAKGRKLHERWAVKQVVARANIRKNHLVERAAGTRSVASQSDPTTFPAVMMR